MLNKNLLTIASLTIAGFLPLAQAADHYDDDRRYDDNRWYVAPFGTFIKSGGDRQASDGWGGGMGIGKMLDKHFNVELKGFYRGIRRRQRPLEPDRRHGGRPVLFCPR